LAIRVAKEVTGKGGKERRGENATVDQTFEGLITRLGN